MANSNYPQYPWLISFSDLSDEVVIRFGDTYLNSHPSTTQNYYLGTAKRMLDLAASIGISSQQMNAITSPHYLLTQWMINYLQEQVCLNNIGLSDVEIRYDKYKIKYDVYHNEVVAYQGKINYQTFLTADMQQSYTRGQSRSFSIYC